MTNKDAYRRKQPLMATVGKNISILYVAQTSHPKNRDLAELVTSLFSAFQARTSRHHTSIRFRRRSGNENFNKFHKTAIRAVYSRALHNF